MAKNRKAFGSKKFIATLPFLVAPSNTQIDQMEIDFHWKLVLGWFEDYDFIYEDEDRFLDWMMEIEDAQFDRTMDDYLCMKMQSQGLSLKQQAMAFLDSMKWANSEAWSWKISPTKEAVYECMFIESYYATGDRKYSEYKPKSVEGYLAITSIDDRRALYASLGIAGYSSPHGNDCLDDPRGDDVFHDYTGPDPADCRDNCQIHGYADFNYWNDGSDDWDISESQRLFDNSFCPEQAIVREIPLHGLKASVRKELTREYCVH